MDNLEERITELLKKYHWSSNYLKGQGMLYVLRLPNEWGLIIRRVYKEDNPPAEWVGFVDDIYFHDEYYFDRPPIGEMKNKPFNDLVELLSVIDNYMERKPYGTK